MFAHASSGPGPWFWSPVCHVITYSFLAAFKRQTSCIVLTASGPNEESTPLDKASIVEGKSLASRAS